MTKTTKKHFEIFKTTIEHYLEKFHLKSYDPTFRHKDTIRNEAQAGINDHGGVTFILSTYIDFFEDNENEFF